ncbi:MAG: RNA polymerase sigma factor [Lewinellaceae bacterium]|nr:RNA polymerase sigma factor [Lewinellaceae bacterium]
MSEKSKMTISEVVKLYGLQLSRFIKSRTKSLEDSEDILQEVWYQVSRLTNFQDLDNISAWLYAITKNKIIDLYRKKKTDYLEDYSFGDSEDNLGIKDILLIDDSANPELSIFKELFWQELSEALDELPENQKTVFVENEIEDKTLQQIADAHGENIKTIISRKGYATKHLRKKLLPLYNEFFNEYTPL